MEKEFTFLWSLWIDCSQFMEDQDEPKCQYGLSFFVGLLYLNQNFTCLGNNLEFNMHGNGHYNHLQNGCETFIIQTMTTILTWLIEFQDDMEWSFRIGINFRYFSFFPCYWIVGVMWQCYICSIYLHGKLKTHYGYENIEDIIVHVKMCIHTHGYWCSNNISKT
jgi:hypothetical protein